MRTKPLQRRTLLKAGVYGAGLAALPGLTPQALAAVLQARGFTHGVASGEPDSTSALLWTRYVAGSDARLRVEIATDTLFTRVVSTGEALAEAERDFTARTVMTGLTPGRWYFYRFIAPDGSTSPVGRTRTLPAGETSRFGLGLMSCSNLGFGWFNAYAHACERSDLDLIVHVGDYLYEYPQGSYPDSKATMPGRVLDPPGELLSLGDYHLRYACYRADADLQRLHQFYPVVSHWDDHELANDAWRGGAENHQPDREGSWEQRKTAAMRAYRDWMPVSDDLWKSYQVGDLLTLFKLETRISGRDQPLDIARFLGGRRDVERALTEFRDGPLADPGRSLLGTEQEEWLDTSLRNSTRTGTRWQVLAQQIIMGDVRVPPGVSRWIPADAPEAVRRRAQLGEISAKLQLPYNLDSWDGYPAARARLLRAAQRAASNLVVLAGDSHNAWGNNLSIDGKPAGVEFATHSVTSPGFESLLSGVSPGDLAAALRKANPGLAFSDTSQRGYTSIQFTPDAVTGSFHFLRTIRERSTSMAGEQRLRARRGEQVLREI
jgi:alkaline phosphatase D